MSAILHFGTTPHESSLKLRPVREIILKFLLKNWSQNVRHSCNFINILVVITLH